MYISDDSVLKMERTRAKLVDILRDKGMIINEDETLNRLIEVVNTINVSKDFDKLLTGIIETIDNNKIINVKPYAFAHQASLKKIRLNNALTLGESSFHNCTALKNIVAPSVTKTENWCFSNCLSLENIILPNLNTAGASFTYSTCKNLIRLITPKCTNGGGGGNWFGETNNLILWDHGGDIRCQNNGVKTLILRTPTLPVLSDVSYIPHIEEIYITSTLVDKLKTATNWSTYADKIHPLEGSKYESLTWYEDEDWYKEEMAVWQ